jgi:hypothetical protein
LLPGAWIGWRGGFIDEVRVQAYAKQRGVVEAFAELLAHPSCRFVRCVGIGDLGGSLQATIDALGAAAPPLLETVVVCDAVNSYTPVDVDAIAGLPSVRRLGLNHTDITKPMPQLVELSFKLGARCEEWVEQGGCANIEALTIDCREVDQPVAWLGRLLRAVPAVKHVKLLHLTGADEVMESLVALRRLETLDVSHSTLSDGGVERLLGRPLQLVALRTAVSESMVARMRQHGGSAVVSPKTQRGRMDRIEHDNEESGGWLQHRIATAGREGVALLPGVGYGLFSVGTYYSINGRPALATPLLDASLTLPSTNARTWAWANAAIAHERLLELDDAELIAREGLLRSPREPNLFAIIVDALRRSDRLEQAVALLPRALATIRAAKGPGAHTGGPPACLCDCLLVLAQAGRHADVLKQAEKYEDVLQLKPHMHAVVAMSQVALGDLDEARASMKKNDPKGLPGLAEHARAVMSLAGKSSKANALQWLHACKAAPYPEWHWIAKDPNLAKLADAPEFRAML